MKTKLQSVRFCLALFLVAIMVAVTGCPDDPPARTPQAVPTSAQPQSQPAPTASRQQPQPFATGGPTTGGPAFAVPTPGQAQQQTPSKPTGGDDWIEGAMRATVRVWIVTDGKSQGDLKMLGGCSGSLVHPSGVVLTNWHCVGLRADEEEDDFGLGITPGEMYHSKGWIAVGLTEDPRVEPRATFIAQVRQGSPELDFAVAKIIGVLDTSQKLPKTLSLPSVQLGDSDKMKLGDRIHVFGYPGIGGPLITKTSGEIAGFYKAFALRPELKVDSFKTNAMSAPGASGGLVTDDRGIQVAIHDFGQAAASSGARFGGEIMINLAKPYVEKAMNDAFEPVPPRKGSTTKPPASPVNPAATGSFGALAFGTGYQDGGGLTGAGTTFPAKTMQVAAAFDYKGMRAGTPWGYVLKINGETAIDKPNKNTWDGAENGQRAVTFNNGKDPLPNGSYDMSLFLNGTEVQRGRFTIGSATPTPPPSPADSGVILSGQIVDADTKRGVPEAIFIVLQSGATIQQWIASQFSEDMVAAYAETNPNGTFITDNPLARGQAYSVAVLADGYKPFSKDNALPIDESDAAQLKLKPISIQRE